MKIPMIDLCYRCKDNAKFNDIVFHDDIIAAEYICDCGDTHRNLLTTVEFIRYYKDILDTQKVICPYCESDNVEYVDALDHNLDSCSCECEEYFYVQTNGDKIVEIRKTKWGR